MDKDLIRVGLGIPANAEFELIAVDDPYNFATAAELSLFRRPLPATNLKFLSSVMWDGRETLPGRTVYVDLGHQANNATLGHAMGAQDLLPSQIESIVNFETSLTTTQLFDQSAGWLNELGAKGGSINLDEQEFHIGINDNNGDSSTGDPFNPNVFNLYSAWNGLTVGNTAQSRAAIARGQAIQSFLICRVFVLI